MNRWFIYHFSRELFYYACGLLIFLLIVEDYAPGAVTLWFNLRILTIIIAASGLLTLLFSRGNDKIY